MSSLFMISRDKANEIAKSDALAHGLGTDVLSVLLSREISVSRPRLYGVSLDNCWVAYIEQSGPPSLRSSTIVVIDREHGKVVYRGSANDEG